MLIEVCHTFGMLFSFSAIFCFCNKSTVRIFNTFSRKGDEGRKDLPKAVVG